MTEPEIIRYIDGVPVKRFAPGVTGYQYLEETTSGSNTLRWGTTHYKFRTIHYTKRLSYLKRKASEATPEQLAMSKVYPCEVDVRCFCCTTNAVVVHHVVPLAVGGKHQFLNVVPLCESCHTAVHN